MRENKGGVGRGDWKGEEGWREEQHRRRRDREDEKEWKKGGGLR